MINEHVEKGSCYRRDVVRSLGSAHHRFPFAVAATSRPPPSPLPLAFYRDFTCALPSSADFAFLRVSNFLSPRASRRKPSRALACASSIPFVHPFNRILRTRNNVNIRRCVSVLISVTEARTQNYERKKLILRTNILEETKYIFVLLYVLLIFL